MLRLSRGKSREGWSERWGRLTIVPAIGRKRIWVHAASVGEVMAATPILQAYRELRPDDEIVLSVITPGGHEVANGMIGKCVTDVFYFPFDAPFAVKRAVRSVQPGVYVNLETELWPNLLYHVRKSGARLILVNGRISDKSFGSYRRLRVLFRWVLGQFDRLLVQSEIDAERLLAMGACKERLAVIGNSKFDQASETLDEKAVAELRADFQIEPGAPVLVVGSTRQFDEERKVLVAFLHARRSLRNLVVIHAPRHVDRAEEVAALYREAGLRVARRTEMATENGAADVILLDTFGELGRVYALADVTFIGNSLTAPGGGQNILQPLAQGKPVIYGPLMQNFRDIAAMAESAGVAQRVATSVELADRIVELIGDAREREEIATRAIDLIVSNRGAAERYAKEIAALVEAGR